MITSLLIGLRHDSEDLSILKDLFHKLDTNNDGTISKEEFEAAADTLHDMNFFAFKDLNWDDVFKEIDLDGNGSVDFHEFCVAAVDHKKTIKHIKLKVRFRDTRPRLVRHNRAVRVQRQLAIELQKWTEFNGDIT